MYRQSTFAEMKDKNRQIYKCISTELRQMDFTKNKQNGKSNIHKDN